MSRFITGSIFKRIVNAETDAPFGVDDLFAAYGLRKATEEFNFGRGAERNTRRQTKFLFHMVVIDRLRDVLARNQKPTTPKDLTNALVKLFNPRGDAAEALLDTAGERH